MKYIYKILQKICHVVSQESNMKLLDSSEVVLIYDVKLKTLFTMAYRNKIQSYKVGSWRKFHFDDLEKTFKRRSQEEVTDILIQRYWQEENKLRKRRRAINVK